MTVLDSPAVPGAGIPARETRDPTTTLHWLILATLVVIAAALRFWRLGQWGFEGDEVFTLQDSVRLIPSNPRPLLYLLNHYVVYPFHPLDELGLRLLPACFGVLAVPALYWSSRKLVGARAALLGALLLVFNPLHLYQSQYARYWGLVFLLSSIYPFAIFIGLRDRNIRLLGLGVLVAVLAVLAHPVSLFLVVGLGVWLLTQVRRDQLDRLWAQKRVRWATAILALFAIVVAVRFVPILLEWVSIHDDKKRVSDHLLSLPGRIGVKQAGMLLAYLEGLTLPLALTGALGVYLLWLRRERELALLLGCLFIVPLAMLLLLSLRTAVSVTYMISTAPVVFIAAGVALDRCSRIEWDLRPRWLLSAVWAIMIIAAGAPTLLSQYRDGRRQDFRGAARWLQEHLSPGDQVFSDQFRTMKLYLPGNRIHHLSAEPATLAEALEGVQTSQPAGALWLVVPYSARGGHRTTPKLEGFKGWIYGHCQLRETTGVARLDFRHNELQIYRCPPVTSDELSKAGGAPTARPLRASTSR
jgi:mannosyltransferase